MSVKLTLLALTVAVFLSTMLFVSANLNNPSYGSTKFSQRESSMPLSLKLTTDARNKISALDPSLSAKAKASTLILTNHYTGKQVTVVGVVEISKEIIKSLALAIYYSEENKVFYPIVPLDYNLGLRGSAVRDSTEIGDPQILIDNAAFKQKAAKTEFILFNAFTFTTKKVIGIDAANKALLEEVMTAIKLSPDNVMGGDPAG